MSTCRSVSSSSPAPFRSGIGGVSTGLASRSSLQLASLGIRTQNNLRFPRYPSGPRADPPRVRSDQTGRLALPGSRPLTSTLPDLGVSGFSRAQESAPVRDPSPPPDFTCGSAPWLSLLDSPWALQAQPLTPSIPILRCHRFWPALQVQIAPAREPLVVNLRQHG